MQKPKYKKLVKAVQKSIKEQKEQGSGLVSISIWMFSGLGEFRHQEVDKAWPYVVKELGLVEDEAGDAWTIPGHGVLEKAFD